jgi:micrococcal nuclease
MYEYRCVIDRVVDGDTVDVHIDLGFGVWLRDQRVRLSGIDAPEIRTRDLSEKAQGMISTQYVESRLPPGSTQTLISQEYNGKGKYGRILGTFRLYDHSNDCWSDLSTIMLQEGLAEPY